METPGVPDKTIMMLSAATLLLESELRSQEKHAERADRKSQVLAIRHNELQQQWPDLATIFDATNDLRKTLLIQPREPATYLFSDLLFIPPFAPYELSVSEHDMEQAYIAVAQKIGLTEHDARGVIEARKASQQLHNPFDWLKVALGMGGAALVIGGIAFPFLAPGMIGAAAGLSGAAAMSHGLAVLGGGALAAGGMGMAGGTAAAAIIGSATLGSGGLAVRAALKGMFDPAAMQMDIAKAEIRFKVILLGLQQNAELAQEVIAHRRVQMHEFQRHVEEERRLNDPGCNRIKAMESALHAMERSLVWMEAELVQFRGERQTRDGL